MYYCYLLESVPYKAAGYESLYTENELKDVVVRGFSSIEALEAFIDDDYDLEWETVTEVGSLCPVKCLDDEDARTHILEYENAVLYERIHNL